MSHSRLARISLLLAAIGLNAAPAIVGMAPAHAAEEKKAPEAPKDVLRPEIYKSLEPAQTKPLLEAKNYTEFQSRIDAAAALPNLTEFESFYLTNLRVQLYQSSGNSEQLIAALTTLIDSPRLKQEDKLRYTDFIANRYYADLKDFNKAQVWFKRYGDLSGDYKKQRPFSLRAYFFNNEFDTARTEVLKDIEEDKKNGAAPPKDNFILLASIAQKTKDTDLYLVAVEGLTQFYPTEDYWNDLLARTRGKKNYSERLSLDLVRLKATVIPAKMEPEDYYEQGESAVLAGFFTEAKIAFDKGFPNGFPNGKDKALMQKNRDSANKGAADDAKNIDNGIAPAQKSKDGVGLVNLGYNYVTLGQFDKGIDLMKQGIAKGVAKNPEDAKLRLGYALAMAGKKDESIALLKTVTGNDGRGDIARYWINYQTAPKITPSEPK